MSCEVYDLKENKWSFISSYNTLLGNSLYSFSSSMAISEWENERINLYVVKISIAIILLCFDLYFKFTFLKFI